MSDEEREASVPRSEADDDVRNGADNNIDNEEDFDDEDEEDEEEVSARPQKRRREAALNPFIEVEAEVDDSDEDEEDEEAEQGFIEEQQNEDVGAIVDENDESHRRLDRKLQQQTHRDAEEEARDFQERYGRRDRVVNDTALVPKRLLLPSVDDPGIFGVQIAKGKGREVIFSILKKVEERAHTKQPLKIYSAVERAGRNRDGPMAEWVYVEARSKADVLEALDGVMFAYPNNPKNPVFLLPIKEMPDLLRVQKSKKLEEGGWVRIKRGLYAGDVAQIYNIEDNGLEIELKIVPRLDYGLHEEANNRNGDALSKRKRPGTTSITNRPPPRPFSESEAKKRHSSFLDPISITMPGVNKGFKYLNEEYLDGYLFKNFKLQHLDTENVKPSLEEVQLFAGDGEEESLDLSALAQSIKNNTSGDDYIAGDTVEIWEGEQTGVWGKVVSVRGDIATLSVSEGPLSRQRIEVPVKSLRKRFKEGDHVKVIGSGRFRDETGMIVAINRDKVTMISDMSQQEITVFSKDLRVATDTGLTLSTGKYGLHDLISLDPSTVGVVVKVEREYLRVLDQFDSIRTITPSQISYKIDKRKNLANADRNGNEIRIDDTVKEVEGERRTGVIMHMHRSFLFLLNREQQENSGIIATRANKVATVAAKGGRTTGATDLSRMNPALQRGKGPGGANGNGPGMAPPPRPMGRDPVIGKTVIICKGQYKGLLGIAKDANDTHARVELHTKNKILPIPKEYLRIKDAQGNSVPYSEFVSRGRGRMGGMGANSGPAGNMNGSNGGGSDGGWAASGGRTPMGGGGRTPAWGAGGRTPAGGGFGGGGGGGGGSSIRVPAWGNSTPAGGSGGRTPGWGGGTAYGGATAYGSRQPDGGKTPGWNNDGGKTPGWGGGGGGGGGSSSGIGGSGGSGGGDGSKTPGWGMDGGGKTPMYGTAGGGDDDDSSFPSYS